MESNIKEQELVESGEPMGKKILISTLYNPNPAMLSTTRIGAERIFLLMSDVPEKRQDESFKLIKDSLGKVIEVKAIKVNMYDIVAIAKECVKIIDAQPNEDDIYADVTSGRKTLSVGLLFAAYARHERVKKIMYLPDEDKGSTVINLPRLSFKLTESQKSIMEYIETEKYESIASLAKVIELSTAMLYRAIDELKDMDLISTENGLRLTDAGKIARL
jgi:CRISPR locus-related DNA-binding protein